MVGKKIRETRQTNMRESTSIVKLLPDMDTSQRNCKQKQTQTVLMTFKWGTGKGNGIVAPVL